MPRVKQGSEGFSRVSLENSQENRPSQTYQCKNSNHKHFPTPYIPRILVIDAKLMVAHVADANILSGKSWLFDQCDAQDRVLWCGICETIILTDSILFSSRPFLPIAHIAFLYGETDPVSDSSKGT
jgi:hypothetical protein